MGAKSHVETNAASFAGGSTRPTLGRVPGPLASLGGPKRKIKTRSPVERVTTRRR